MNLTYTTKDITRFLCKIELKTFDDCWEWKASSFRNGYGSFRLNNKTISAHRFSYRIYYGQFDSSLFVCHSCDNVSCCNPFHLFLGTNRDNMVDMATKGRRQGIKQKNNSSGYVGVSFHKRTKQFKSYIYHNSTLIHLGYFDTAIEAAKAYDEKALELIGSIARFNFPR